MQNNQNCSYNRNATSCNTGFSPNAAVMRLANLGPVTQYGGNNNQLQQGLIYSPRMPSQTAVASIPTLVDLVYQTPAEFISQDLDIEFANSMTSQNQIASQKSNLDGVNFKRETSKSVSFKNQNNPNQSSNRKPLELMQLGNSQKTELNKKSFGSNSDNLFRNEPAVDNLEDMSSQGVRILSGSIDRIMSWYKIIESGLNYYEVVSRVISIQNGNLAFQKILLLRDIHGPILQVIFYDIDYSQSPVFSIGQMVRCIGIMIGQNKLRAFNVREAVDEEPNLIKRLSCISEHTVNRLMSN